MSRVGAEIAGAGMLLFGLGAGIGSQLPEAWACTDSNGNSASVHASGEIPMVHCDEENMGPVANRIHDVGKGLFIVALPGAGVLFAVSRIE